MRAYKEINSPVKFKPSNPIVVPIFSVRSVHVFFRCLQTFASWTSPSCGRDKFMIPTKSFLLSVVNIYKTFGKSTEYTVVHVSVRASYLSRYPSYIFLERSGRFLKKLIDSNFARESRAILC